MLEANRHPFEYLKQAHYQSYNLVSLLAVIFEKHFFNFSLGFPLFRFSFFSVFALVGPRKMARLIEMTHFML